MTNEEIASLRALDAAAKRPPWTVEGAYVFPGNPDEVEGEAVWIFGTDDCGHPPTAALIVAFRNALPHLLDEREALLEALKVLVERLDGDREFVVPDGGAEMLVAAQAALAKAEAP